MAKGKLHNRQLSLSDAALACGCEYTNSVTATPTEEFLDFIKQHGISFEQAAAARQAAGADHNRRETPLFAESIARKALVRSSAQRQ